MGVSYGDDNITKIMDGCLTNESLIGALGYEEGDLKFNITFPTIDNTTEFVFENTSLDATTLQLTYTAFYGSGDMALLRINNLIRDCVEYHRISKYDRYTNDNCT
eukprot:297569_1